MKNESIDALTNFIQLLETEKTALMTNDGEKLIAIVAEKETFVDLFPTLDFSQTDPAQVEVLVQQIRDLQETNLLLTKQNLSFNEKILQTLSETVKKSGGTYSKQGQPTASDQASFLNQSL